MTIEEIQNRHIVQTRWITWIMGVVNVRERRNFLTALHAEPMTFLLKTLHVPVIPSHEDHLCSRTKKQAELTSTFCRWLANLPFFLTDAIPYTAPPWFWPTQLLQFFMLGWRLHLYKNPAAGTLRMVIIALSSLAALVLYRLEFGWDN